MSAMYGDYIMRVCPTHELNVASQTIAPHAADESEIPVNLSGMNRASASDRPD